MAPKNRDDEAPEQAPADDQAPAAGNMATFSTSEGSEMPDDSDTTPLSDLDIQPPAEAAPSSFGAEPAPVADLGIDFTPVTMDVEPDYPNGPHRTVQIRGNFVKVAAGKGVTIPLTVAEILGHSAEGHRTEQIRQGGVPPILDLTSR